MKRCIVLTVLLIVILFHFQSGFAQSTDEINTLKKEIEVLKEGQKTIQKELQDIKSLLGKKPAPAEFKEVVISIDNNPVKGDKNAKLAIVEFSDYQ